MFEMEAMGKGKKNEAPKTEEWKEKRQNPGELKKVEISDYGLR